MRKVVLVAVLTVALVAAGCGGDDDDAEVDSGSQGGTGHETPVEVTADDFAFEPATIDGEAGETLTLEIENAGDAPHTFTVDELDVDEEIPPGESVEVEVTVPDSGGVDFYCRFHEGRGMKGAIGTGGGADTEEAPTTTAESGGGSVDDGY